MKRRELLAGLAAAVVAEGCTIQPPGSVQHSQAQESQARYTNQITLPKPSVAGTVSLEEKPSSGAGPGAPSAQAFCCHTPTAQLMITKLFMHYDDQILTS